MRTATLRNKLNGVDVRVLATTDHPDSSYGRAMWVDDDNNAYCEVDSRVPNPFYDIMEDVADE